MKCLKQKIVLAKKFKSQQRSRKDKKQMEILELKTGNNLNFKNTLHVLKSRTEWTEYKLEDRTAELNIGEKKDQKKEQGYSGTCSKRSSIHIITV